MLTTLVHIFLIWNHTIKIIYLLCFKNYYTLINIHISRIHHISYLIILKNKRIDVLDTCRIRYTYCIRTS